MQQPPFTALAAVYDAIMQDVEYDHWADFVLTYARESQLVPHSALDLACGTGNFTRELVQSGIAEVWGADLSTEMLKVAQQRFKQAALNAHFCPADLRTFELGRHFELITCVFDSLNNLLTTAELQAAFCQIHTHLTAGGFLACDLNTCLGVRELWEDNAVEGVVTTDNGQEVHYYWSHNYDNLSQIGTVQALCRLLQPDGSWQEFSEVHQERGYDPPQIAALLQAAGFARWEIVEYPDYATPTRQTPRVWVLAWKEG